MHGGGEDDVERLLRQISERRDEVIGRLARGGISADNVQGGYRESVGYVRGMDAAEELVRDVLRAYLPEPLRVQPPARQKSGDY